ncbi:NIPSNAP family protein [Pigmentiphaga sp.]|uniref:NIPSNAP family protein n=1 Tax=Pigmentiphaga sp. TaxID=1977564 RepID=UPI0025FC1B44|nr:NIPSNAP family protein [Pigmentiphaga sp.]
MPIDELRIYTVAPGGLAEYLRLAQEVAVPVRGDAYGRLLGFWFGEIGSVHRIFNLWQHDDLQTRQAARARLAALPAWRDDYVAKVHPLMQEQEIRLMEAIAPLAQPPAPDRNIYETRLIRTKVGKAAEFAALLRDAHPDAASVASVGIWTTQAGRLNEVVQILAYRDVGARLAASLAQDGWRAFLARHGHLVDRIESSLMLAAAHSPLR